jgi:hypothetical protein
MRRLGGDHQQTQPSRAHLAAILMENPRPL